MELLMMSGGDSADYDTLTAKPENVVSGNVFMGAGSDEPQTGTLPDRKKDFNVAVQDSSPAQPIHTSSDSRFVTDTNGNKKLIMCPPNGAYPGTGTYVGEDPERLGIVPEKIADGQFIGNVEGTFTEDGTAEEADIRSGMKAYVKGKEVNGGAADYGAIYKELNAGETYNIKKGFYGDGRVVAKGLSSQTNDANVDAGHMVKGYSGYSKGNKVEGAIDDCGPYQYAGGIGEYGDYYAFNNVPSGWYHDDSSNAGWAPELRLSKATVRNYLGIAANKIVNGQSIAGIAGNGGYAGMACISSFSANYGGETENGGRKSFRMPRAGRVFYGGATGGRYGSFLCAIYKNGSCVDDRNMRTQGYAHGYGDYMWRGTMFNQSFYANAGDLIEVETSVGGSNSMSCIQAVILY